MLVGMIALKFPSVRVFERLDGLWCSAIPSFNRSRYGDANQSKIEPDKQRCMYLHLRADVRALEGVVKRLFAQPLIGNWN